MCEECRGETLRLEPNLSEIDDLRELDLHVIHDATNKGDWRFLDSICARVMCKVPDIVVDNSNYSRAKFGKVVMEPAYHESQVLSSRLMRALSLNWTVKLDKLQSISVMDRDMVEGEIPLVRANTGTLPKSITTAFSMTVVCDYWRDEFYED